MNGFKVLDFRPMVKNSLQGFFTLELPSQLVLIDCSYFKKPHGGRWISLPSRKTTRRDGSTSYESMVEIRNKHTMKIFTDLALDALDRYFEAHHGQNKKADSAEQESDQDEIPFLGRRGNTMNEIGKSKKSREVEPVVVTLTDEDLAVVERLTASRDREPKKSERITDEEPLSDGFGRPISIEEVTKSTWQEWAILRALSEPQANPTLTDFRATKDDLLTLAEALTNEVLSDEFYLQLQVSRTEVGRCLYATHRLERVMDCLPKEELEKVLENLHVGREKNKVDLKAYEEKCEQEEDEETSRKFPDGSS